MTNGKPSRALVVREQTTALARLVSSRTGLSPYKVTTALDDIEYSLHEDEFRALLRAEVSPADIAVLLSGRFDLVSSAMLAAEPEDVVAAIVEMALGSDNGSWQAQAVRDARQAARGTRQAARGTRDVIRDPVSPDLIFVVLSCAEYLKERSDWNELCETEMANELTFGDWIVIALWMRHGRLRVPSHGIESGELGSLYRPDESFHDEDDDLGSDTWEVTADTFEEVGLDMVDALERLRALIANQLVPTFSTHEFVEARQRFAERQTVVRSDAAQEMRAAADKVVGEDDL